MKRNILIVLLLGTFIVSAYSQVVTTNPEFPIATEAVTITFNAAGSALEGYTGDLYVHTGVTIEGVGQWQNVIGTWGNNSTQPQLTRTSIDIYSLEISSSINDYYGIEAGENVTELCFVFRSSDGNTQSSDIFTNVYESGLNVNITSPTDNYIIQSGGTINIEASSIDADSLFLFIDDVIIDTVKTLSLSYVHTENEIGLHKIEVIAKNSTDEVSDSVNFYVRGTIPESDLPSGWIKGINYFADDSVGLVLFAPNKEFMYVIGDFNNWELNESYIMNRTTDGEYYWLAIGNLTPQQEYIFQYFIDGEIRIADPYTQKTSDPNDQYISEQTYPGLIDYPEGKTTNIASVLQTNQDEYQWQSENFTAPVKKNLIIYELLVRDFLAAHDYNTLIDTLNYLDSLGINAIELMPVSEFEGNESWGYNPSFYFAPDKYYGPKENLKEFIDACHERGIAVILDMVLNHSYGQSPLVRMYYNSNTNQPTAENPWYNVESPNSTYSWGNDFNHESEYTKEFVDSVNSYWLKNYKVDGFRFDFTKGFTNAPGDGWAYDASRIAILKRMADQIWNVNSDAYIILEHFTENSEEIELSNYGMLIWGNINHEYREASKGNDSDISWGLYTERGWSNPNLVSYMESHDEERLMYDNITSGNSSGSYSVRDLSTALERVELAANFFIPIPGPKMIWQFGEIGYDVSIDEDCRVCNKPILWDYFNNEDRFRLYQIYKTLNKLKLEHEVFTTSNFSITQDGKTKILNLYSTEMNVVVMGNFDVTSVFVSATFPSTGEWYELYSGDTLTINHVDQSIIFEAGEYRFYTDVKLEQPDLPTFIYPTDVEYGNMLVYPNPTSGIINFDLKDNLIDEGELFIYDIQGKQIVNKTISSDNKQIELDITQYKDGIYFYRLVSNDKTYTGKVLKK